MRVDRTDTGYHIEVGEHVPALVLIIEAEARPHMYGPMDPETLSRVLLGLSDEWQALLLAAVQAEWGEP